MTREFHLIFSSLCPELASVVAVGPPLRYPLGHYTRMECSHRESVRCQMTQATWVAFRTKALQYRQYRPESIRRKGWQQLTSVERDSSNIYIYIYIFFLNIFRSAEGQEVPPHSFDIAFDICVYIYIYHCIHRPRARGLFFARGTPPSRGTLPRTLWSAALCAAAAAVTQAARTLCSPSRRTHGRRAARPHLQSPHGRRRTAAAMRPVASETRGTRAATAQILAVLKSWQKHAGV